MKFFFTALPLVSLLLTISGCQAKQQQGDVSTIFQLNDSGTWFENLAIRPDGEIIATRMDTPELSLINPITRKRRILVTVPGVSAAIGISQHSHDTYVVGAGNVTPDPFNFETGSMKVFLLEFKRGIPRIRLVTALPDAMFINGMTPWSSTEVLVSDTVLGAIYRIDVGRGTITSVLSHADFAGINGLQVQDGNLYYASISSQTFFRVPITSDFAITGSPEAITSGISMDDFALTPDGTAYIATAGAGQVLRVTPDGATSVVVGGANSTDAMGCTSARLGRSKWGDDVLYVTTNGGVGAPVNGSVTEPAKLITVKVL